MRDKYMVRRPLAVRLLKFIDACLPRSKRPATIPLPKRILLSNLAHLGDVVIATSILPALKEAYPDVEIGFLCGSWSTEVLKDHPDIQYLHTIDRAAANRSGLSSFRKKAIHLKTAFKAFREIRKINYDIAIDLYYYFGNSVAFLWLCGIPVRVGFTSAGCGPLLTHPVDRQDKNQHLSLYFLDLLKELSINNGNLKSSLAPLSDEVKNSLREKLPQQIRDRGYLIFHMGTGHDLKCWEEEKWRGLAQHLSDEGFSIIFTGKGKKDRERIKRVMEDISNATSLCDQLSFQELCFLIKKTRLLISVDSVPQHIAAVYNTPLLLLFCGMNQQAEWMANHANAHFLMESVPCAPCYNPRGCASMQCIRGISVDRVYGAAKKIVGI
jgi:ADP-heptose:LPS heptosyltransferase